jgi:spore germination protein YaaH
MIAKRIFVAAPLLLACGITPSGSITENDTQSIPTRHGTVIADGCLLDSWQMDALDDSATKKVVQEVVLDCLLPHADGTVTPADASGQADLDLLMTTLRKLGYTVSLAASFTTDDGYTYDGTQTATELTDPTWIEKVAAGILQVASQADGVELDLEQLPATAQPNVTKLVSEVATLAHVASKKVGVFLPPSTVSPSDVVGGDAFDVATLGTFTDRFRVMTLDFSGTTAGPTIDTGWAVDAVRFAQNSAPNVALDVAYPLYGNDFSLGTNAPPRFTTFLEAQGLASTYDVVASRSPSRELMLDYTNDAREPHELWYDDSDSTLVALHAWDAQTLPTTIGVVYYGFGAEDPALWAAIAGAEQ